SITIDKLTGSGSVVNTYSGAHAGPYVLTIGANNGTATFSGVIKGAGGGALNSSDDAGVTNLVKAGSGVQTLSGANTYGGTTTINGGTLRAGAVNTLPATTAVTLASTSGVTLDLNGNNQTV